MLAYAQYAGSVLVQAITAIAVAGWQMIPPALITTLSGWALNQVYMAAQLPLKRLKSNSKAPIIGHIQNALVSVGE